MPEDYIVAKTTKTGQEIRKFGDAQIQSSIDKVLKDLPAGKKGAAIFYVDGNEAKVGVYGRVGRNWSYVCTGSRQWSTGVLTGEAALAYSW